MEINKSNIISYLHEHTTLLNRKEPVEVTELTQDNDPYADGYVNFAFRVRQGKNSYVLKQARNYLKVAGIAAELSVTRNYMEAISYELRGNLLDGKYVPQILHLDRENNLYVAEDLGNSDMKVMRFALCRGKTFPDFAPQIGEFLAKCHFYTSELYLTKDVYCSLLTQFINPQMRTIMEDKVLLRAEDLKAIESDETGEVYVTIDDTAPLFLISEELWKNTPEIKLNALEIRDIFTNKMECLIHGDLHTSNIFINEKTLSVIDMEYSFMGPFGYDLGYLLANILSQFAAYTFNSKFDKAKRLAMQEYFLATFAGVFEAYFRVFAECFARDGKELFRSVDGYLERLFVSILQDSLGFLASSNMFRIINLVAYPDYDYITDENELLLAKGLSIAIDEHFMNHRKEITTVKQAVEAILCVRDDYLFKFGIDS